MTENVARRKTSTRSKTPKRRSQRTATQKSQAKDEKPVKRPLGRRAASTARPGPDDLARIALDLFAQRHFASVTIKEIGSAAQVNSAMIYYHYEDKADLFRAAIESAIDEAFELFAEHCNNEKHENAAEAINAWFDVHVMLHKRLRNVIKISLDCKGIVGNMPEANEPIQRFYRHEKKILQDLIQNGIEIGIFREVDTETVAIMISTMLDGVLARSIFLKDFQMVRTVEAFKQTIMLYLGYTGRKSRKLAAAASSR